MIVKTDIKTKSIQSPLLPVFHLIKEASLSPLWLGARANTRHLSRQVHQAGGKGRFAAAPIFIIGRQIQQPSLCELIGAISQLAASRGLFFQK
jgi:hypothetical protein